MNDTSEKKLLGLLGIARKAGKLCCGTPLVVEGIRSGKCLSVVVCRESSANTVKRLTDSCTHYHVPLQLADIPMQTLAHAVGKTGELAAVGIMDAGFSKAVMTILSTSK